MSQFIIGDLFLCVSVRRCAIAVPPDPRPSPDRAASSLVGRERELATLRTRLDAALIGQGRLVLIGGEAGIGKTALAEALCAEAAGQGALVLTGRCYDLTETPPYGPWVGLFARYHPTDNLPSLPDQFQQRGTVGTVASQAELFNQVQDFFTTLAATRPVLLLLDDLHWADPASLDLLRFLARSISSLPLLILATYRADELTRRHSLYQLLPVLVREAHADRLDLQRIEQSDVHALVLARYPLPDADTARLVAYLHHRSEGNPFFLGELLRTLEAERILRWSADGWMLGDLTQTRVPALLRQVIDGRLSRLDQEAQRLLAVAAVIGQEVPLRLWASVVSADEETLAAVIEQATTARMLEVSPDGGVRFAHALIREALYEEIAPIRRRAWHRQVGEQVAMLSNPDPDAVAYHFRQAEDRRAVDWLIRAGERARDAYAWVTAVQRFERALAMTGRGATDAEKRGMLLYRLARLRRYADPRRAIADLDDVARIAAADGDHALAALALFCRGMSRTNMRETIQGLTELAAGVEGLRNLSAEDAARLEYYEGGRRAWPTAHGTLVKTLASVGRFAEALALAERDILDEPEASETGKGSFLSDLHSGLGIAHAAMGQPEEARRAFARARAVYRAVEHHVFVGWTAASELLLVSLVYQTDHLAARRGLAIEGEEALQRASGGVLPATFSPRLASLPLMLVEGAWEEACSLTRVARADPDVPQGEFVIALLGQLARDQGDTTLAWQQIAELLPDGSATEPTWQPFHCAQISQRVAVALVLDAGDLPLAHAWLEAHDRWLAWSGAVLGRSEGHRGWAHYYRAAGDAKRAIQHARKALAHANDPRQPLALLAAHRLLGELDTDAGTYADAVTHLDTALSIADACAAPYERALTLLAFATLRIAMNEHAEAGALIEEVRAICVPLGAKPALARADTLASRLALAASVYPAGLSAREVDVLRLLATGRSNRDIADALFLSEHTIHVHVRNIFTKTRTENRTEAAAFALRHGLA